MSGWLATQDVLDHLGLDVSGPNLDRLIPVAERTVESWRSDIIEWPIIKSAEPAVYEAGVQVAGLLYQSASTPEGFAGFSDADGIIATDGAKWTQLRRLARANRPKVG